MEEYAVIVVRGLGLGAVFALVAMSLNAVHRASGIFNFAQGAMMVLGGIIAARYMPNVPDPYRWFAVPSGRHDRARRHHDGAGLHHAAAAALLGRAALVARLHARGLGADRRGHPADPGQHPDPHHQPVPELPAVRHAHAGAVPDGDRPRARLVRGAALVPPPHADRAVDQRGRAGSRRGARGGPARAPAADCSPSASAA